MGDDCLTEVCRVTVVLSRHVLTHGPRQTSSQLKPTLAVQGVMSMRIPAILRAVAIGIVLALIVVVGFAWAVIDPDDASLSIVYMKS